VNWNPRQHKNNRILDFRSFGSIEVQRRLKPGFKLALTRCFKTDSSKKLAVSWKITLKLVHSLQWDTVRWSAFSEESPLREEPFVPAQRGFLMKSNWQLVNWSNPRELF
jgi:hypothetical protein